MNPKIIDGLKDFAPSVSIQIIWEHDLDARWDIEDETLNPNDFVAWQSEVKASCISNGEMMEGSAYMGGTWEKYGDNPEESNPEISGYLNQMVKDALEELGQQVLDEAIKKEIDLGIVYCRQVMQQEYDEQMARK